MCFWLLRFLLVRCPWPTQGGKDDGEVVGVVRPNLTRGQLLRIACGMLGLMLGWAMKVRHRLILVFALFFLLRLLLSRHSRDFFIYWNMRATCDP